MNLPRPARDVLAGLAAGAVVLGLGGRLLMRAIALGFGGAAGFSWGGTVEVVVFGALVGAAGGLAYGLVLRRFVKPPLGRAIALGLGSYLVLAVLPYDAKMAIAAFPQSQWPVILLAFAGLFVLFGLATEKLAQRP